MDEDYAFRFVAKSGSGESSADACFHRGKPGGGTVRKNFAADFTSVFPGPLHYLALHVLSSGSAKACFHRDKPGGGTVRKNFTTDFTSVVPGPLPYPALQVLSRGSANACFHRDKPGGVNCVRSNVPHRSGGNRFRNQLVSRSAALCPHREAVRSP